MGVRRTEWQGSQQDGDGAESGTQESGTTSLEPEIWRLPVQRERRERESRFDSSAVPDTLLRDVLFPIDGVNMH